MDPPSLITAMGPSGEEVSDIHCLPCGRMCSACASWASRGPMEMGRGQRVMRRNKHSQRLLEQTLGCSSTSAWELNLQRPEDRSIEDLISPHWAGISTLAVAPGCCGVAGPVPSTTLDKRCW